MAKKNKQQDQDQDETKVAQQEALDTLRQAQAKLTVAEDIADKARVSYLESKDTVKELALARDKARTACLKAGIDLPRSLSDLDKVTV